MTPADFDPRADGPFVNVVIGYLIAHAGQRVELTRIFNSDCWAIRDAVDVGRHVGLCITGHKGKSGGYTLWPLFARPTNRRVGHSLSPVEKRASFVKSDLTKPWAHR
jgi:hypothetical protein